VDYDEYCDEFEREGARFVARATQADVAATVPGCPDWRVSDLLAHVGFVHRWARHLVAVRASDRISAREMALSRGPVTPAWLAEGVRDVLVTLRVSDPDDAMWAWGADQHVRFWARRMLHETLVHRVDLEEAMGVASEIDSIVALDAIDEFLANLERAGDFSPAVKNLVGTGEVIAFRTDEGPHWDVRLSPNGFEVVEEPARVDAVVNGPACDVLLVLYRRRVLTDSSCVVQGRADLVLTWLANCALL
jgi:uncharacterized protein (TIGR03083 family)